MEINLVLDVLKIYFNSEIANKLELKENSIIIYLENKNKVKITVQEIVQEYRKKMYRRSL